MLFVVIVVESNEKEKETCSAMLTRPNDQCSLAADISIGNCLPLLGFFLNFSLCCLAKTECL